MTRTDAVREEVACDGGGNWIKHSDEQQSWGLSQVVLAEGGADTGRVLLLLLSLEGGDFALLLLGGVGWGRTAGAEGVVVVDEGLRGGVHLERFRWT